ncbi:hypothetical protein [Petroclostridium sp. X23]|nr:hypothetical protein [Petroclostridium sp. X23]WHH57297.1 hypothetical protein QKW49_15835 [Petroclostridium sp. X23]
MTRKNMKGVVGKGTDSIEKGGPVGVGLDFKKEKVTTSQQIEEAIKKKKG